MTPAPQNPVLTGIELAVQAAGSQMILATQLTSRFQNKRHPTQQAVSQWVRQGFAPPDRAREIAELTGVHYASLLAPKLRALLAD